MNHSLSWLIRGAVAAAIGLTAPIAAQAGVYNISVDRVTIDTGGFKKEGIGYNGASPGPVLRFKEGEDVVINVTNNLDEATSIHWHGLILPYEMDGVPTVSYAGIEPGETFTYEFKIVQSGTYWYHSHSGFQEPSGAYGAIVIESKTREPFRHDRDYVIQLADPHPDSGARILRNLKMMPDYYNREQRTVGDFFKDAEKNGFAATVRERMAWGRMRMTPADVEDLQGFTPVINGKSTAQNWTGIFKPGERVRLRFINSSAMTYFDIRIPGLKMTVVQADGNNVQPVTVDELRIAVAETYDVVVQPTEDRAYAIFAESMGRTASVRGTLSPRENMAAETPEPRQPPLLTMADMGMRGMQGMEGMDESMIDDMERSEEKNDPTKGMSQSMMKNMAPLKGMDRSMMKNMAPATVSDPFYAVGSGLAPVAANGGKFLSYRDLKAQKPLYEYREATREIELRLTGNMERYIWSINDVKYEDAEPIRLKYGERVRFKFVNETMMTHPMHLHGMWSILDTGAGKWNPVKHTVSVAPGATLYMETEVDAVGQWVMHCHLSYHAAAGMFRRIIVGGGPETARLDAIQEAAR